MMKLKKSSHRWTVTNMSLLSWMHWDVPPTVSGASNVSVCFFLYQAAYFLLWLGNFIHQWQCLLVSLYVLFFSLISFSLSLSYSLPFSLITLFCFKICLLKKISLCFGIIAADNSFLMMKIVIEGNKLRRLNKISRMPRERNRCTGV